MPKVVRCGRSVAAQPKFRVDVLCQSSGVVDLLRVSALSFLSSALPLTGASAPDPTNVKSSSAFAAVALGPQPAPAAPTSLAVAALVKVFGLAGGVGTTDVWLVVADPKLLGAATPEPVRLLLGRCGEPDLLRALGLLLLSGTVSNLVGEPDPASTLNAATAVAAILVTPVLVTVKSFGLTALGELEPAEVNSAAFGVGDIGNTGAALGAAAPELVMSLAPR